MFCRIAFAVSFSKFLYFVWQNPSFLSVVTGPPGTGKSYFIALYATILKLLGRRPLICAPSNVAVDAVMSKVEEQTPESKAIRFHSLNFETSTVQKEAIKAQRSRDTTDYEEDETDATMAPDPDATDPALNDLLEEYARVLGVCQMLAYRTPKGRPNFKTMSLMSRCLDAADLATPEAWERDESDTKYSPFRDLFLKGPWKNIENPPTLAKELAKLQAALIQEIGFGGTTLSNAHDKVIADNLQPTDLFIDEAATSTEAETLIAITKHADSLCHIYLVGDIKQLKPVITSHGVTRIWTTDGQEYSGPVCTFEAQIQMPLMQRLQMNSYPSVMFLQQHRMYPGLEQPSSHWFYRNRLMNAPGNSVRPRADKAIGFMASHYGLETNVPRGVFNLAGGICMKDVGMSRYNPHHVSFTMSLVENLVAQSVFLPREITIITPYRAQTTEYRKAMYQRSLEAMWQTEDYQIWDVKVMTIDSMQGGEAPCIIE